MKTFKKYNSIENSYRDKFLGRVRDQDCGEREYVVQEKVHGANISFHMGSDSTSIRTAKRTGFLRENEKFFNYQRVRDRLEEPLLALFAKVELSFPDYAITTVGVYGELFGGMYDHPEVEIVANVSKVQKGIHYHPDVNFYAFDILVNNETYLDADLANDIFEEVGLFYARTLYRGNLEAALAYPNEFDSKIGEWLGLPSIEGSTCEGVIIRPVKTVYLRQQLRVILKNKNTKWEENQNAHSQKQMVEKFGTDATGLQEILKGYLTTKRVHNVMSKMSEHEQSKCFTKKDIAQIMREFMPDAMEDFDKDHGAAWNTLSQKDRKKVIKDLKSNAFDQICTVVLSS